ncbi:hypothetical protein JXA32_09220 [Candidatus Sumerlaeota bacterium]|nr:hypothetical protein [Candidatus Sumerlaeota bacterium]
MTSPPVTPSPDTQSGFNWRMAALFAVAGALWRIAFIYTGCSIMNGDQAIFGIQAQHIWLGKFPLYFTGQHYLFPVESYFVALMRLVTVQITPLTLKLVAILEMLVYVLTLYGLLNTLLGSKRLATTAALLALLAPAYFTQMSVALNFLPTLILGQLMLWLAALTVKEEDEQKLRRKLAALAALAGFAWFQYPFVAPYIASTFAILLLFDADGQRRLIRHIAGERPLLQGAAALPYLVIFFFMLPFTWNDKFMAWRNLFQIALLCWIPLGALALLWDEWLALKKPGRLPLPAARLLVYCSIGIMPQLIYIFLRDDVWYAGKLALGPNVESSFYGLLLSDIPIIAGPLRIGLFLQNPLPPPVNLLLLIALFALIGMSLIATLRRKPDESGALNRRGVLLILIHAAVCIGLKLVSENSNAIYPRHLLTLYTALFALLAIMIQEFRLLSRHAGATALAIMITVHAFFTFIPRDEKILPISMWPVQVHIAAQAMRAENLHAAFCPYYDFAYPLLFALGPGYDIAPRRHHDRFPELTQKLQSHKDFAIFLRPYATQSYPRDAMLTYDEKKLGEWNMLYNFRYDGRPITFAQLHEFMPGLP